MGSLPVTCCRNIYCPVKMLVCVWPVKDGKKRAETLQANAFDPLGHLGTLNRSRFKQYTDNYSNCQQKLIYSVINSEILPPLQKFSHFSSKNLHHEPLRISKTRKNSIK